jgi:hypothetical protein
LPKEKKQKTKKQKNNTRNQIRSITFLTHTTVGVCIRRLFVMI